MQYIVNLVFRNKKFCFSIELCGGSHKTQDKGIAAAVPKERSCWQYTLKKVFPCSKSGGKYSSDDNSSEDSLQENKDNQKFVAARPRISATGATPTRRRPLSQEELNSILSSVSLEEWTMQPCPTVTEE